MSSNFPTSRGAFQTAYGGKWDGFVTKLAASGATILYSSYLGGAGEEGGSQIAVSAEGRAYIVGGVESSDFPTARPAQASLRGTKDGFLTEIDPAGASLLFSTYLGGGNRELFEDVALDARGAVVISGLTSSDDFPVVRGMQNAFGGGMYDIVVAKFARAKSATTTRVQLGQQPQPFQRTIDKTVNTKYLLFLPQDYGRQEKRWPLILYLHGGSRRGDDIEMVRAFGLPQVVEKNPSFPFIVVSPQCPQGEIWTDTDTLINLLDDVTNKSVASDQAPDSQQVMAAPAIFAEGAISTGDMELNAAFTPDGKTLYFTKRTPKRQFWAIVVSHFRNGKWSAPEVADFSGQYSDFDPFISPDGSKLYFSSIRPMDGKLKQDSDIWVVEREKASWGAPHRIEAPINTPAQEYYSSVTADGTLYFSSTREGGKGKGDIYRSKLVGGGNTRSRKIWETQSILSTSKLILISRPTRAISSLSLTDAPTDMGMVISTSVTGAMACGRRPLTWDRRSTPAHWISARSSLPTGSIFSSPVSGASLTSRRRGVLPPGSY
jgi:hypothetical protein